MCVSVLYHCVSFSTTVYQYFHQCQYFQHCVSMCVRMCTTVSVFPQLCVCISTTVSVCVCVRVCQHLYHCVSISTTVCQYFHRCQYFQHGVSVSSTVSVNTVSVCPCNGVSSQSIVSCSAVKYPSHTHTHTHTQARGVQGLCMRTASWRTIQQGPGTVAHRSSQRPRRALAHHRRSHTPPRRRWGTGRNSYTTSSGRPQAQDFTTFHHNVGWLGWFGLASWVGRLARLVWACFVGW